MVSPNYRRARNSVSAEVPDEEKKPFELKRIHKSNELKSKLKSILDADFTFGKLSETDIDNLIDAMEEANFKAEETVINEGEDGDFMYLVESGKLRCTKFDQDSMSDKFIKDSENGYFGELALLYNSPRKATIRCIEDCRLWALDRKTFTKIIRDSAMRNRELYQEFLREVSILEKMDEYERSKLVDALEEHEFQSGDTIIQQGDPGAIFYIIKSGSANAVKEIEGKSQVVKQYGPGDYFGERALLKNEPRAASIVVTSEKITVASFTRAAFKKLFGPLQDILYRNMDAYSQDYE